MDTVVAWIAARSGKEGTALLGKMPGAMVLLPGMQYCPQDGSLPWLVVRDSTGREVRRPTRSPYADIYANRSVWGLADGEKLTPGRGDSKLGLNTYLELVEDTAVAHGEISEASHPNSVNLVSAGLPTAERIELDATQDPDLMRRIATLGGRDDARDFGFFQAIGKVEDDDPQPWAVTMRPRSGDGDATVPTVSAIQPGVRTVRADGITHADLLNDRRTHALVVDEIERMLQQVVRSAAQQGRS